MAARRAAKETGHGKSRRAQAVTLRKGRALQKAPLGRERPADGVRLIAPPFAFCARAFLPFPWARRVLPRLTRRGQTAGARARRHAGREDGAAGKGFARRVEQTNRTNGPGLSQARAVCAFQNLQRRKPALMSSMASALIHSQLGRLKSSRTTPTSISPTPNHLEIPPPEPPERFLHALFMPSPPRSSYAGRRRRCLRRFRRNGSPARRREGCR